MSGSSAPARSGSLLWAQGLACGGVVAFAPALGLLAGALFLPVLAALLLDRAPGRPVARAVALCVAAASVEPIRSGWSSGLNVQDSLAAATDIRVLGLAWGAGAAGWVLTALAPLAARALMEAVSAARAARLRAERTRLSATWEDGSGANL